MKTIVTHMNPDLDSMTSVWLLKRFGGDEWSEAEIKFVPAGSTYKNKRVDSDPDVMHVDVGMGILDHHQFSDKKKCGAVLVLNYLIKNSKQFETNEALERLVEVVRDIDWAGYLAYPQPTSDRYGFLFYEHGIISGLQKILRNKSDKQIELGLIILDGIYEAFKSKVNAEAIIKNEGIKFKTKWGKGMAAQTDILGFVTTAQAKGFSIVVSKGTSIGNIRIHAFEFSKINIDLSGVWETLKHKDPNATWFLHSSKKMVLNGSRANPDMIPTKLNLNEVIEVLKNA
jgi:hypothetical protein